MDSNPPSARGRRVLVSAAGRIVVLTILFAIAYYFWPDGESTEGASPSGTMAPASAAAPATTVEGPVTDTSSPDPSPVTEMEGRSEEPISGEASAPAPAERDCSPRVPEDFRLTETSAVTVSVEIS